VRPSLGRAARLPVLDGWRAIAISLVVWHHAIMSRYGDQDLYWNASPSQLGAFGVDIFFGLSGLLITSLLLQEYQRTGSISLPGFYTRRIFRILPPVFALLAVLSWLGLIQSPLELASCLGFFRNYLADIPGRDYTRHLWSLAVEEHFYLLWPALLVWLCRKDRSGRPVAYLSIFFGLWRVFVAQTHITSKVLAGVNEHFRTDLRADALLWGCFVAFLIATPESRERVRRYLSAPVVAVAALAAVVCVVMYSMLTTLWFAMLVPVVLTGTMLHPEWSFCRILELAPIRFLGRLSYSLYLWQGLFLVPGWQPGLLPKIGVLQHWPWNLPAALAVATASYLLIEKPCMEFGRHVAAQGWLMLKPRLLDPAVEEKKAV
jgi:peptidoglycan/LPS O-acetylase OafA/YrhL